MLFLSVLALVLLIGLRHTNALALFGRHREANATLTLDKRQGTVLNTRFSSIFSSGDGSKVRTANGGFDCRVDLLHDLWGFCPSTVIAATDCGLAGSCVDNFACSKGCGKTDQPLTTFTCSDAREPFCSTALLTLSNNVGPFSYIACGRSPNTDNYMAVTTAAKPSTTTQPTSSTTSTAPTSPRETASTAPQTSSSGFHAAAQSTTSSDGPAPTRGSNNNDTNNNSNNNNNNNNNSNPSTPPSNSGNNIPAIIGGTVGCLALVCACAVAIVWLLRRKNRNAANAKAATSESSSSQSEAGSATEITTTEAKAGRLTKSPPEYKIAELSGYRTPEMSARGPAAYDTAQYGLGFVRPDMPPVELPAVWHGGR
ncbi:hypothetical protein VTI74DRAFT_7165 [Chaetomium olivicolor]